MRKPFPVTMVSNLLVLISKAFGICLIAAALCISANTSTVLQAQGRFQTKGLGSNPNPNPNQTVWKFIPERHKYCYVPTGMVKWMTVKV